MTELAIVLPILCLLLFGIIQFGILYNNYVTVTDARAQVRARRRSAGTGSLNRRLQAARPPRRRSTRRSSPVRSRPSVRSTGRAPT